MIVCRHSFGLARIAIAAAALLLVAAPARAQDAHGAVAYGQTAQGRAIAYGFAWNYGTGDEARTAARNACREGARFSGGISDCELVWFQNGCGALAVDRHGAVGASVRRTREQAETHALRTCTADGGSDCAVVGVECASPGGQAETWSGRENILAAQEQPLVPSDREVANESRPEQSEELRGGTRDSHGAIAAGWTAQDRAVAYGFAWNQAVGGEAQAAAVKLCKVNGGTNCTVLAWFRNGCGALAMDQHGTVQGAGGLSQEQAETRALQACETAGGAGCAVVGSQCASRGGQAGTWSGRENILAVQEQPRSRSDEVLTREQRTQVQRGLTALGFDAGPADGMFGPRTRAAIQEWRQAKGLNATGHLTEDEAKALAAVRERVRRQTEVQETTARKAGNKKIGSGNKEDGKRKVDLSKEEIAKAMAKCENAWTGYDDIQVSSQCKAACGARVAAKLNQEAGESAAAQQYSRQADAYCSILSGFGGRATGNCSSC